MDSDEEYYSNEDENIEENENNEDNENYVSYEQDNSYENENADESNEDENSLENKAIPSRYNNMEDDYYDESHEQEDEEDEEDEKEDAEQNETPDVENEDYASEEQLDDADYNEESEENYYKSRQYSNAETYNDEDEIDEDRQEYNSYYDQEDTDILESKDSQDKDFSQSPIVSESKIESQEIQYPTKKRPETPEKKYNLLKLTQEEIRQRFLRKIESKTLSHRMTGAVYEGATQNLRMESEKSIYRFPNGDYYEGGFLNGAFHGEGTIYFKDAAQLWGEWEHGELKKSRFFFKDNLEWKEKDWEYCKEEFGDRRLWSEIVTDQSSKGDEIHESKSSHSLKIMNGIRPRVVGHSFVEHLQGLSIVQNIPKGTYDTGDGYYVKNENVVKDYVTHDVIRQVHNEERDEILSNYRIGKND